MHQRVQTDQTDHFCSLQHTNRLYRLIILTVQIIVKKESRKRTQFSRKPPPPLSLALNCEWKLPPPPLELFGGLASRRNPELSLEWTAVGNQYTWAGRAVL